MIVATRLTGKLVDARADGCWFNKAHYIVNFQNFPCRDAGRVHRRVVIGVDLQYVIEDCAFSGKIAIGVVGEIYGGCLVGGGDIVD